MPVSFDDELLRDSFVGPVDHLSACESPEIGLGIETIGLAALQQSRKAGASSIDFEPTSRRASRCRRPTTDSIERRFDFVGASIRSRATVSLWGSSRRCTMSPPEDRMRMESAS